MSSVVELVIPPRSDHLALVRIVIEIAASIDRQIPERRIDDLRLAVSEAAANAVDAQLASGREAPVHIGIELEEDLIAVTVTDHAGGFDVEDLDPIPPVTDPSRLRHERGLGIPLMRSLVDETTFTRTPDGTAVRLVVRGLG
jgi:anti-sigma regulatory factor (Ser/Thr protein kinase)